MKFQCKHLDTREILKCVMLGWNVVDRVQERYPQAPIKVIYTKLEKLAARGYIDCGVSIRGAWLTDQGKQLLEGA